MLAGVGRGKREGPNWTLNWGSLNPATNWVRAALSRLRWSLQEEDRLESRLVDVLAPEAEILRPASGGVFGQYFGQGVAVGGDRGFAPEEQGFGIDVRLYSLPSGGFTGESMAAAVGHGLVGPPGTVTSGRRGQWEANDGFEFAEGGFPLLGWESAQVRVKAAVFSFCGFLSVLLFSIHRYAQFPCRCQR